MTAQSLQTWSWVSIYAGVLLLILGFFVVRQGGDWGWALMASGLVGLAVGIGLIVRRSRLTSASAGDPATPGPRGRSAGGPATGRHTGKGGS